MFDVGSVGRAEDRFNVILQSLHAWEVAHLNLEPQDILWPP